MFVLLANMLGLGALFGAAEFAVRWHHEGGFGPALRSLAGVTSVAQAAGGDGWLVADPLLGYRLNPAHPDVNALGVRHAELEVAKPRDLFRVLVLGDSVAWGQDGFVTRLRERMHELHAGPAEVINAAIPGYTTYQQRHLLERDLLPLEPDLVILQYCLNDNHQFLHRLNETGRWLVTPDAQRTLLSEGGLFNGVIRSSYLLLELRPRLAQLAASPGEPPWDRDAGLAAAWKKETWQPIEQHLESMRHGLTAINARFAVVAVPIEAQLDPRLAARLGDRALQPQRELAAICRKLAIPFLDLYPAFLAARTDRLFTDGLHLTRRGHDVAALELLRFLREENLGGAVPQRPGH